MRFLHFGFDGFNQLANKEILSLLLDETGALTSRIRARDSDQRIKTAFLGWSSVIFLTENGKVVQSGFNSCNTVSSTCVLNTKSKIINVACCWNCLFLVTEDGKCLQWKNNDCSLLPIALKNQPESLFLMYIATGDLHTVIIGKDGRLYNLSNDKIEKLPFCTLVNHVCCGKEHVVLLTVDANVFTYGLGSRGQLGHGTTESEKLPRVVEALEGIEIQKIAAGGWHSVALSVFGDVYIWGWNESGQLGQSSSNKKPLTVQALPQLVDFPNNCIIKSVACGSRHTAAVSAEGELWMWGWNEYNQLGFEDKNVIDHPVHIQIPHKEKVKDVICGYWSTIVILDEGQ